MTCFELIQILSIIFALVGTFLLAFGLKIRPGISPKLKKELDLERKNLIAPSSVHQRGGLITSGLALITLAALLEMIVISQSDFDFSARIESINVVKPISLFIGLLSTYGLGLFAYKVKTKAEEGAGKSEGPWAEITEAYKTPGKWVGIIERGLFFLVMWTQAHSLIIGILAFKVASKWETWKNIIQVPEKLDKESERESFQERLKLGGRRMSGFLVGTLFNLICGIFGFLISEAFTGLFRGGLIAPP